MRRVTAGIATIATAAVLTVVGLKTLRPDQLRAWTHLNRATETPSAKIDESNSTKLESDAPDDGWCAHLGSAAPKNCPRSMPTVRLDTADIARKIGIETAKAEIRHVAERVAGNAEITFVLHDFAHITSRVAGRIASVPADEGESVKKGDVLVVVDSAEVGTAKAQYLSILPIVDLARTDFERTANLFKSGAASEKEKLTAQATLVKSEAELLNARQRLFNMGLNEADITGIARTKDTSNLLKIEAPMAGRLVERHAVIGEAVTPPSGLVTSGQMLALFEIADLRELWAWIDVSESEISKVMIGQPVRFTISGTDKPVFSGMVELISYSVNVATRTVRVRAKLENIDERLRANQYGRAVIQVGPVRNAIVVPRAAVQSDSGEEFVFIPQPDGRRFRTQRVQTRPTEQTDLVEISFGLKAADTVVTTGSFSLKGEVFKSKLGAD
ncbi:MAG: family efflux transporter, subunit [Planctomycetota bacterium]|nr:family efflux transporter, subunit [Planctomycetota bacterium]